MKTKNKLIVIISVLSVGTAFSQGSLVLDNANVIIENNATMYVVGDVLFQPNTELYNNGTINLDNDWINNSTTPAINNTTNGLVVLSGDAQNITGNDITDFYNLELKTTGSIKSAQINTNIVNNLDLADAVLETNQSLVHLQNGDVSSLQWNEGYVSGANLEGYFLRSTNQNTAYAFPVGSSLLDNDYRAVEITPSTGDSSVFGVRLGALDASVDFGTSAAGSSAPFDLEDKANSLGALNENFYHSINRFYSTTDANASIYFFNSDAQNVITAVGKWNSTDQEWQDDNFSVSTVSNPKPEYNTPNKVATTKNALTFDDDVYVLSDVELVFPTGFSPNGDLINDNFVIENLEQYPDNELIIYNRWGEQIYYAKPYLNDWGGVNISNGIKLQGDMIDEDTYYYILKLDTDAEPIKNFFEVIID